MVMPGPGGIWRGRPREEVEWMRMVSLMTASRLGEGVSRCFGLAVGSPLLLGSGREGLRGRVIRKEGRGGMGKGKRTMADP